MIVCFQYTNHRGEIATRRVIPRGIRFASTPYHPKAQWLLDALDLDRNAERSFAMVDISKWRDLGGVDIATVDR